MFVGLSKYRLLLIVLFPLAIATGYDFWQYFHYGALKYGLFDFFFFWLVLLLLFIACSKLFVDDKEKRSGAMLLIVSVFVSMLIAELFLRVIKRYQSSIEARAGYYQSPYKGYYTSLVWEYTHNIEFYVECPEYKFKRTTNAQGIGEGEIPAKDTNEYRVLALGDSFTDGDGAPHDSAYPAFLQGMLNGPYKKVRVINGGVCGSDPFFNYMHLKQKMISYKPDLVIQNISSQDLLTDVIIRGGMERFDNGKIVHFRGAPGWEPLYAISYLCRSVSAAILKKDLLLLSPDKYKSEKPYLDSVTVDLLKHYNQLGRANNFKTIFMLRPYRNELPGKKYDFDFSVIEAAVRKMQYVQWGDLMNGYLAQTQPNSLSIDSLYWPQNGHHNAKGYKVMAKAQEEIIKAGLIK